LPVKGADEEDGWGGVTLTPVQGSSKSLRAGIRMAISMDYAKRCPNERLKVACRRRKLGQENSIQQKRAFQGEKADLKLVYMTLSGEKVFKKKFQLRL